MYYFIGTGAGLCIYHLFVWSNLNSLHISQWITLPTEPCLVLYSFCAKLLHSLIMWLMVSSLSLHCLPLLFCCILSIVALIWLVLTVLFLAAIRRDSVSLLKFPFLSHVQVLSREMLFISRSKRPLSCFSSHFCFLAIVILLPIVLSVSFLMALISRLLLLFLLLLLLLYHIIKLTRLLLVRIFFYWKSDVLLRYDR